MLLGNNLFKYIFWLYLGRTDRIDRRCVEDGGLGSGDDFGPDSDL